MGLADKQIAEEISSALGEICGASGVEIHQPGTIRNKIIAWKIGLAHGEALKELKDLWDEHCLKKWPAKTDDGAQA